MRYHDVKMAKNFSRVDPVSFGVGVIVGCFIVTLTYASMPKTDMFISLPILNSQPQLVSTGEVSVSPSLKDTGSEHRTADGKEKDRTNLTICDPKSGNCGAVDAAKIEKNFSTIIDPIQRSSTIDDHIKEAERRPLCDTSNHRCDLCDIDGDVHIIGKNLSSVILVAPSSQLYNTQLGTESWVVKPYARKWDKGSMVHVREVKVTSSFEAPRCTVNHSVPAVVFSVSGYTGNYFHDFTDVLVPLFQTAGQFDGQVQFVIANYKMWWVMKYQPFFKKLSNYDIIDYDNDDKVHCFKRVIVGLRSDRDLMIEPANSPKNYSMVDFMKFMRETYSLERDYPLNLDQQLGKKEIRKPRLLIIARGRTRKFVNLDQIVAMAKETGFEVVIAEADFNVVKFAHIVNSCDVMMGVHGAGLTNFVFLPSNAVLIQVVPFGKLDWIASTYFGEPAKKMKLNYLEYTIREEESTLTELYSRNDPVFKDPKSIHKRGWFKMGAIYLDKQNVKLDVKRFRPVLEKALEFLHQNVES